MKLLQINVTANWGSTGKIAEDIGKLAMEAGWESWIAYGRGNPSSASNLIRIGSDWDMKLHGLQTRILDKHGLASRKATKEFIKKVKEIAPDVIHLHNIHGYYLNYPILFEFLKEYGRPIIWTLHDCWSFTGHCAYYDFVKCNRWIAGCHDCPQLRSYPASIMMDRSARNYEDKRISFLGLENLTFVPVSDWLDQDIKKSFLKDYPSLVIHNGIDLDVFRPREKQTKDKNTYIVLGVASVWEKRKGLDEFVTLRKLLPDSYNIVLVGLSKEQISGLPNGIKGISRTDSVEELVDLYSKADVFVNPTLEDNFPTTNLEALACGTPVITYDTGGSPEAIDEMTGVVVPYKDVNKLAQEIQRVCEEHPIDSYNCRKRAEKYFNKQSAFKSYIELYNTLIETC